MTGADERGTVRIQRCKVRKMLDMVVRLFVDDRSGFMHGDVVADIENVGRDGVRTIMEVGQKQRHDGWLAPAHPQREVVTDIESKRGWKR
jgi:hypothetical protein